MVWQKLAFFLARDGAQNDPQNDDPTVVAAALEFAIQFRGRPWGGECEQALETLRFAIGRFEPSWLQYSTPGA